MFFLTSFPKLPKPPSSIIGFDKLAHFVMYLILGFLYVLKNADFAIEKLRRNLFYIALLLPLLDEIHQIPIPGRTFSWYDIIADILGISFVLLFLTISYKSKQKSSKN